MICSPSKNVVPVKDFIEKSTPGDSSDCILNAVSSYVKKELYNHVDQSSPVKESKFS